ncbi:MAG TPA: hypothetical protein VGS19_25465 [Streptosporangiaceae bacterium]|nr:hypothetical protein [Streptosporangiaceae bacterium]
MSSRVHPARPIVEPLDEQPQILAVQHSSVVFGMGSNWVSGEDVVVPRFLAAGVLAEGDNVRRSRRTARRATGERSTR